ncbi:hypothetical protein AAH991_06295 [Microbispora sp. ZYX-F-249]|uniref:Uncharacterized protein n=1 Tax=Microbispora maris TaxID=3144104 RepID=A0ABV0AH96_9ACTN
MSMRLIRGGAVISMPVDAPNPLAGSVLSILVAARELRLSVTETHLVGLLYLTDVAAVEAGHPPITGATWRLGRRGPYDPALTRAQGYVVESELVERGDDESADAESAVLFLTMDVDDPLDPDAMDFVRSVVALHGGEDTAVLRSVVDATVPVVEAQAGGESGVLLDLSRARRRRQATALLTRARARRASMPPEQDDANVGAILKDEFLQTRDALRRANAKALDDR